MRIVFLLICFVCCSITYGQGTFEFRSEASGHQMQMDVAEINGDLYCLNGIVKSTGLFMSRILKINSNGDTNSTLISLQDTGFLAYKIILHKYNYMLLLSATWTVDTIGSSGYLSLIQCTTNLNFISRLNIAIPTEYINIDVRSVIVVNESIWIFGHAIEQFGCPTRDDLFFAVLDSNVNLINIEFYKDSHNPDRILDVKWDSLNHTFRAITEGLSNTSFSQYVTIDANLNITKIQDIPLIFEQPHNLFLKGPNDIVLTNAYRNIASLYPDTKVNIAVLDSNMQLKANMYWDSVESYDPPAWFKSLAVLDDGSYAIGGTIQIWFHNKPSWFVLGRATEGMLGMWERYYGGDYYYNMCNMIHTSDGGYAMGGWYSDTLAPYDQGIYILKVHVNGLLHGLTENEVLDHSVLVYYDFNQQQIVLRTALPDVLTLRILDLTGRTVYTQTGIRGDCRIPCSFLHAGTYLYEVSDIHHHRKTGKIILP